MRKMTLSEKIFEAVQKIPYGRVATYAQIGTMCGNPYLARVVGNTLHKNTRPDITPCYRVVNSKGRLATNFGLGGMEAQSEMLKAEGVEVIDGYVDLKKYQWKNDRDFV